MDKKIIKIGNMVKRAKFNAPQDGLVQSPFGVSGAEITDLMDKKEIINIGNLKGTHKGWSVYGGGGV